MNIAENINAIKIKLPENVSLVAVSKFKPNEDILEAYEVGQRIFGENYVQELVEKQEALPKDIEWHFIGHLQRNKVKAIAPFVHLIHGVDSLRLLEEINKQGKALSKKINCLLQLYISTESTKEGLDEAELSEILKVLPSLEFVYIKGLMGMASFTDNTLQVQEEFKSLKVIFEKQKENTSQNIEMEILSMGMSGDYELAIENGSNMIRLGTIIFGNRK
jgi:PLP dependent protein